MSESQKGACRVCRKLTPTKCARCRRVYYCSKSHQTCDWGKHKTKCQPLDIERARRQEISRREGSGTRRQRLNPCGLRFNEDMAVEEDEEEDEDDDDEDVEAAEAADAPLAME